ncbi:WD40 repeat domain-containing protein [Streptomyces nogalater]
MGPGRRAAGRGPAGPPGRGVPGPLLPGRNPAGHRGHGRGRAGTVRVWDLAARRVRHEFTGHAGRVYTLDFHPDGRFLVSGDTEERCGCGTWGRAARPGCSAAAAAPCTRCCSTPTGHCSPPGTAPGWSACGGSARRPDRPRRPTAAVPLTRQPTEHRGSVWVCKFRPHGDTPAPETGSLLVTGGNDGIVRLWDPAAGQGRRILRGHGRRINSLSFSADGSMLAAAATTASYGCGTPPPVGGCAS